MRCVIWNCLDLRDKYDDVSIVYGARTVNDLVYKHELADWGARKDVKLWVTVDPGGETPDWKGKVGFVPTIVEQVNPKPENTIAIVCGPPIMIKLTMPVLAKLGFKPEQIYTTLRKPHEVRPSASAAAATWARSLSVRMARCLRSPSSTSFHRSIEFRRRD